MFVRITGVKKQVLVSLCLYLGQIAVGYNSAWTGTITPKLEDPEQSPIPYNLTDTQLSLVGTIAYLGAIPGPYVSGWLSNIAGRKPCLLGSATLACIGSCLLSLATNIAMVYCGRVILGFAEGILTVMSIVYIGEIASTNIRGILLILIGISQTSGTILMFGIGTFLSYSGTTFCGFGMFVCVAIGAIFIPESPLFYVLKGDDEKVKEALQDLGRSEDIDKLLSVKKEYVQNSSMKDWSELFTIRSNRKAFFIVLIINLLQNTSGFTVVLYFCGSIFKMAGSSVSTNLSMIIIVSFQLIGSVLSSVFVERAGRRVMLLISTFLCSLSMFLLGLYFYLNSVDTTLVEKFKWFPLVILVVYSISYDFGFAAIPNVIVGEMFTSNVRSKGSTLTMTLAWLYGFLVTTGCGILLEIVGGHVIFWFFTCVCACAFLFTFFFLIETKGKSLLEIQELLNK
ncbi:facilitated trehalose transporter Tret1-like isoform X1 [Maniola jurtina]|uniref:facilitated trehalose transporter Tret1-like isoform X1 n=1 Tax=Maniola jurtina TaxID=191418 RepID=UPI001E68E505|nr:facilitated trehalose transporter Tret1-like isoform X1 [Maniola jurtina]